MLLNLLNEYYQKLLLNQKQVMLNNQVDNFLNVVSSKNDFKNMSVLSFLDLLFKTDYNEYSFSKLKINLEYIQKNNMYEEYKDFLIKLFSNLNKLKQEISISDNLDNLVIQTNELIETITNKKNFIKDFSLILNILKEQEFNHDILFKYLNEINNYNKTFFNIEEQEKLEKKEVYTLESLFNKYNYSYNNLLDCQKELISSFDLNELDKKLNYIFNQKELSFLKEKKYTDYMIILLIKSNELMINKIISICTEFNINISLLDPSVFCSNDSNKKINIDDLISSSSDFMTYFNTLQGTYEYFIENIKILQELGYDISYTFQKEPAILIYPTQKLKENIDVYNKYGFDLSKNNMNKKVSLAFLMADDIQFKLDSFIEIGLFDYIKTYRSRMLNKDKAFFYRVRYAKDNNLPIKRGSFLVSDITNSNGYNINEQNYLEMVNSYHNIKDFSYLSNEYNNDLDYENVNSLLKILDDYYKVDDNTYCISQILVSRKKVIRLFNNVLNINEKSKNINLYKAIIHIITKDLIINKDEYENIVVDVLTTYYDQVRLFKEIYIEICDYFNIPEGKYENLLIKR